MNSAHSSNEPTLQPTLIGYIETTQDRCLLFEACLSGLLHHIPRFPRQCELQRLIRSGNIFVYADPPTGPGPWDDGKNRIFVGREDILRIEREHSGPDALMKKSGTILLAGVLHHFVSLLQNQRHSEWDLGETFGEL